MFNFFGSLLYALCSITCLVTSLSVCSQIPDYYEPTPIITESNPIQTLITAGHAKATTLLPLEFPNLDTKNYTKEQMEKREKFLLSLLSNGDFILDTPINAYVERVFQSILKANPQIDQTMAVLVSRNPRPNAFNTGDNLVVVHLGLLERIHNEAELAFVLSHEIAHQTRNHVMTNLIDKASYYYSDSVQKKISTILRSEYFVLTQLNNFVLPGLRASMAFSREEEFQADSLGFYYYDRTGYDKQYALSLIHLLASFDSDRDTTELDYKKIFSHSLYPYNERWSYVEEISSLGTFETDEEEVELEKQLQSHPDTPLRHERVSALSSQHNKPFMLPSDTSTTSIVLHSRLEIMNDHIRRNNYGKAIHQLAYLIKDYPESSYLKYKLAYLLTFVAIDKKKRTLGKHMDLKDFNYSNSYNTTLNMLWEMRSAECFELANHIISDFSEEDVKRNPHILAVEAIIAYYQLSMRTYQNVLAAYQPETIDTELEQELYSIERELGNTTNKRK